MRYSSCEDCQILKDFLANAYERITLLEVELVKTRSLIADQLVELGQEIQDC